VAADRVRRCLVCASLASCAVISVVNPAVSIAMSTADSPTVNRSPMASYSLTMPSDRNCSAAGVVDRQAGHDESTPGLWVALWCCSFNVDNTFVTFRDVATLV
jgi:hypothetical protein